MGALVLGAMNGGSLGAMRIGGHEWELVAWLPIHVLRFAWLPIHVPMDVVIASRNGGGI